MSEPKSVAHKHDMNHYGLKKWPDRLVPWRDPVAPDVTSGDPNKFVGRLRGCDYCGSLHPADFANAIRQGFVPHWADFKYGWPHKMYCDVPNPHAGKLESRSSQNFAPADLENYFTTTRRTEESINGVPSGSTEAVTWHRNGAPANASDHGKFYTVHLQDAAPDDRAVIEAAMGLHFTFSDDGAVSWSRIPQAAA